MGASIVFVPLVIWELIALPTPNVVLVSMSLMPEFELVMSYPDAPAVEKYNCWVVTEALRLGFVTSATLKTPASVAMGTPFDQLPAVLKSVPVLSHVVSASAEWASNASAPNARERKRRV